jgi:hypothetical protein
MRCRLPPCQEWPDNSATCDSCCCLAAGLQSEVLLPGYLVTTLTLCLQSISAALYPLQCGQRQHVALPALLYVADCSLSATAPVPKGLCTSPGPGKRTASGNQQASLPSSDAVAPVDLRGLLVAALATCHRASRLHSELTPRQHYHPGRWAPICAAADLARAPCKACAVRNPLLWVVPRCN